MSRQNSKKKKILDCGGGVIFEMKKFLDKSGENKNIEQLSALKVPLLKNKFIIIYLKRKFDDLVNQETLIAKSLDRQMKTRPVLGKIPYSEILQYRLPHYQETADIEINVDSLFSGESMKGTQKKMIISKILQLVKNYGCQLP